jgi:hypothetical protein
LLSKNFDNSISGFGKPHFWFWVNNMSSSDSMISFPLHSDDSVSEESYGFEQTTFCLLSQSTSAILVATRKGIKFAMHFVLDDCCGLDKSITRI